jgi:PadR family transcriptional regulator, regulatory protein AphA
MTTEPTTTSQAILGLLALRPWTTYELAKQVQRSLGWFWPRAERKLYDEPKRLVAAGLATSKQEMTGARPRTVYGITARGRKALRKWLGEPPSPPSLEFEGLVKVFFADSGTLDQLRATLTSIAATSDARVAELADKFDQHERGDIPFLERRALNTVALRFQYDHEQLIGDWAHWAHEQIADWNSPTDEGAWDFRTALPPPRDRPSIA